MFENRQYYRLPLNRKFVVGKADGVFAGTCVNVSSGGAFINLLDVSAFKQNDKCQCVFSVRADTDPITMEGVIKRVVAPSPNPENTAGIAVQFEEGEEVLKELRTNVEEMRHQFELVSTILEHGEPEIRTLQPILEKLNLRPFMDMGELHQYVERILQSVEIVEKKERS
ncbi:hypothetical protein GW915_06630 [bacterium]|nr:hypothetical protein [bacterium]